MFFLKKIFYKDLLENPEKLVRRDYVGQQVRLVDLGTQGHWEDQENRVNEDRWDHQENKVMIIKQIDNRYAIMQNHQ